MIMGTFGKSTSTILYHAVDDAFLIERINSATRDVSLTAPGISMAVASAMMKAVSRLDGRVQLLVDATPESFHLGYNDPQVIRFLQQGCRKMGLHTFYSESGLRVGVLTVDDATTIFTPGVLTLEKLSPVSFNAASPVTAQGGGGAFVELTELADVIIPEIEVAEGDVPKTKEEQLQAVICAQQKKIDSLEKKVKDLEREKGKLPIQQNLQFVEIKVSKYRLDKLRIRIPSAFLTNATEVNDRMDSKYLVLNPDEELNDEMELTIHENKESYTIARFFNEIERLREDFTVTLGPWKRGILTKDKDAFEAERRRLDDVAWAFMRALPCFLEGRIKKRLEELYQTLKPQIENEYRRENWWDCDESEKAIKHYFDLAMQQEIDKSLKFFDPQFSVIYMDISREDAESPRFRREVENSFGKLTADKMFKKIEQPK